jgi:membrane protease YdiL (CAAX protease family)
MRPAVEAGGGGPRWMALLLGGLTLLVFGAGGALLITVVQERDLAQVLPGTGPWWRGVAWGLVSGALIGLLARTLVRSPWMRDLDERFARRIGGRVLRWQDRLFLSVCAGVGEELFFRGALQHWLGIVPTAVLFVGIHGYLDPRDRRMLAYGAFLTLAMCGIGVLAREEGLLGPMVAHTVIDLVLFAQLVRTHRRLQAEDAAA